MARELNALIGKEPFLPLPDDFDDLTIFDNIEPANKPSPLLAPEDVALNLDNTKVLEDYLENNNSDSDFEL
jgi:hypothetical protein